MKLKLFINKIHLVLVLALLTMATACEKAAKSKESIGDTDSLMNAAYQARDYDRILQLADETASAEGLSAIKANYWKGYAYSRQRKMRLAENYWQKAVEMGAHNEEELVYYAKSANRLSSMLVLTAEYEKTMKVAVPAMEKMSEANYVKNEDYAYLLLAIGCCQLKLESPEDAAKSFDKALKTYLDVIDEKGNISSFTSAIVGIITITDNYLMQKRFEDARSWTERFKELLTRYTQLPNPDANFLDKQYARYYLYRASALEGLGNHAEAAEAYAEAQKSEYAKTGEGQLEATGYLMSAQRWNEAARNFETLNEQMDKFDFSFTLDNIQRFVLPKYRANYGAHRVDSALILGLRLCDWLDTAIVENKQSDAAELATLYSTQQKETELVKQRARMSSQRFLVVTVVLLTIILSITLILYYRRQHARRLQVAYHELEIANARAEESSRMKTNFIQQISHEIRTPLNILSGFTQIIATPDMELDEDTKQDVSRQILENTNRITGLVKKMLELSDANSQTVIERNDHVLAVQIAAQGMDRIMAGGEEGIIPIDLQLGEGTEEAMLQTNEQEATRVLELLLGNAEKFTNEGQIRLKLEKTADMMRFIVEDTGIGVPPAEAEHIFEEFVQLDSNHVGTGIGLTVARSLSQRMGGDVVLDTSYTGGARFIMTLPL